jgi:hypothetical protein
LSIVISRVIWLNIVLFAEGKKAMPRDFPYLLCKYMKRIKTGDSKVANAITEILYTGENIHRHTIDNWKSGCSLPDKNIRHKVIACAKFLRLTVQEANEFLEAAKNFPPLSEQEMIGFLIEFKPGVEVQDVIFEEKSKEELMMNDNLASALFVDNLRGTLDELSCSDPPVMVLLTQSHWNELDDLPFREALLTQAKQKYSPANVLHIKPSASLTWNVNKHFSDIGQQLEFEGVEDAYDFEKELKKRLENNNTLLLLISRLERAPQSLQEQLGATIRGVLEETASLRLHVMLWGCEKLADLNYLSDDPLSLVNIAQVKLGPELSPADVLALCQYRFQDLQLDKESIDNLLTISGGHPRLLMDCIKLNKNQPNLCWDDYPKILSQRNYVWDWFTPFTKNESDKKLVYQWLQQPELLGKTKLNILDNVLRKLFWKNLLKDNNGQLCWRCKALRMAGLEILGEEDDNEISHKN